MTVEMGQANTPQATFAGDTNINATLNTHANSTFYYPNEKFASSKDIEYQTMAEDKPYTNKGNIK